MPPTRIDYEANSTNYYDCVDIAVGGMTGVASWTSKSPGPGVPSYRLFGNAHIGNQELTNLQIPGQMPGDCWFIVKRWYVRHNIPAVIAEAFNAWANSSVATFIIGNRRTWLLSLFELAERRPRAVTDDLISVADPFPTLIPPRQNFSVHIDQYGTTPIDKLNARCIEYDLNFQPRLWVHLDGIEVMGSERHVQSILARIQHEERKLRTAEERIASWILGAIDQAPTDTDKGTLNMVRDAILEGRHRS